LRPFPIAGIDEVTSVAAGDTHTCALRESGEVACWGSNSRGQLGDGTGQDSPEPVTVTGIADAVAIASGAHHSCAVFASGKVACWGSNDAGELGKGSRGGDRAEPITVSGIDDAATVEAGEHTTCILRSSGEVACWGLRYDEPELVPLDSP
jgi:alpha-tubulin suppressor-like RCC1 family protein